MMRHVLAMHVPSWGRALRLPLTLEDVPGARAGRAPSVALTFDDGPHPEGTPAMLARLAASDARAIFFVVGEQVLRRPALARRILEAGHELGLHGHRHRPHPLRSSRELARDFEQGLAAIEDATGRRPRLHRPPFGIYSPASLRLARERGLQPLLWSRWGRDWRRHTTAEQIATRVVTGLRPSDVILLHDADYYSARDSHRRTAAALPIILDTLKSAGLGTVTDV